MTPRFSLTSSGVPAGARVAGFHGVERVGRCYGFDVDLVTLGEDIDVEDAVGSRATLTIAASGQMPMPVHGILADVEHVRAVTATEGAPITSSLYRARMVPALWFLGLTRHSRIFTNLSVVDLIRQVLELEGISSEDFEFRLARTYEPEAHICQYDESSLDFLLRWIEREGLCFHFEHDLDRPGELLVFTDDKHFLERAPGLFAPVPYRPQPGDWSAGAHFDHVSARKTSTAAFVRGADYDYAKPTLDVSAVAPVTRGLVGEQSPWKNRAFTPDEARHLARVRAEALHANALAFRMAGPAHHLRSGRTFEIGEHPTAEYNTSYLAIAVEHTGRNESLLESWGVTRGKAGDDDYRADVRAIPARAQYRLEPTTPWPRVDGIENGVVDGPKDSEYAQIDAQGRYLLKMKFDEGSLREGKASTWVRMMQPHGGGTEGFHFPLRKGTEVACVFLGGDPDRPVIVGVVPNALTPSPVIDGNNTQNVLRTGGGTYMQIEDQQGTKFASLLCPYTTGMESELYLGNPRPNGSTALTVPSGPQRSQVGEFAVPISEPTMHLRTTGVGMVSAMGALDLGAGGPLQLESDSSITVYAPLFSQQTSGAHVVHIGGTCNETTDGSWTHGVSGAVDQLYASHHSLFVGESSAQTYGQGLFVTVGTGDESHDVTSSFWLRTAVDANINARQTVRIVGKTEVDVFSPSKIELSTGGGASIVLEHDTIKLKAKFIQIEATSNAKVTAADSLQMFAGVIDVQAMSGDLSLRGEVIDVQAMSGDLALRGGPMVKINT
ncbi:MAG: type VI secretion system tip protein VgrG [Polyangiaceae bacterium]|nr:type VI secretion system tip protein VgrG [Polyangiaceae bacterium]